MKWLWDRAGIIGMFVVFAIFLTRSALQAGLLSMSFFWTAVICGAVATLALTARQFREKRRLCPGA